MFTHLPLCTQAGRVTLSVSGIFLPACIELGNTSVSADIIIHVLMMFISILQKSLSHVMSTWLSQDFRELCCTTLCSIPPNRTELDLRVHMVKSMVYQISLIIMNFVNRGRVVVEQP